MLSTCCRELTGDSTNFSSVGYDAYTEVLQVVEGDLVAEKMDQSILEHASVAVAAFAVSTS